MLEQWEAKQLIHLPKVYSHSLSVSLRQGADEDYAVESDDGTEHFILDVLASRRNRRKARFQLRYRRSIVLVRLCTAVTHGNPDGIVLGFPHLHTYREPDHDKWAKQVDPFNNLEEALGYFCQQINLPLPEIQGGLS